MAKEFKMGLDVSDLPDFLNENTDIVTEKLWSATTLSSGISVIVDQKGKFALNSMTTDIYLQSNQACGFTPSGNTSLLSAEVDIENLKSDDSLCAKSLLSKYYGYAYGVSTTGEPLPFESYIVETQSKKLAQITEKLFWTGDKTNGTGNMVWVDGVAVYLDGKSSNLVTSASGTTTKDNVIQKIEDMYFSLDQEIKEGTDNAMFVDPMIFDLYTAALKTSGLYQGTAFQLKEFGRVYKVDGWNIEIISTGGLIGTDFIYASSKENFVWGTDVSGEETNVSINYYDRDEVFDIKSRFNMGVGVYFPNYVSHNNPAIS